jgi:hypothetical protein
MCSCVGVLRESVSNCAGAGVGAWHPSSAYAGANGNVARVCTKIEGVSAPPTSTMVELRARDLPHQLPPWWKSVPGICPTNFHHGGTSCPGSAPPTSTMVEPSCFTMFYPSTMVEVGGADPGHEVPPWWKLVGQIPGTDFHYCVGALSRPVRELARKLATTSPGSPKYGPRISQIRAPYLGDPGPVFGRSGARIWEIRVVLGVVLGGRFGGHNGPMSGTTGSSVSNSNPLPCG